MEVDNIIFPILKDIGCKLPEEVNSIKLLQSEHIYSIAACCLNAIDPEKKISERLPEAKAARFRVTTSIAAMIKELGFNGELGYQSFLYPAESEMRTLLSFLIDKVPRVDKFEEDRDAGVSNTLNTRVSAALTSFSHQKWTLFDRSRRVLPLAPVHTCALTIPTATAPTPTVQYYTRLQPWLTAQPGDKDMLAPSVFQMNARDVVLAEEESRLLDAAAVERKKAFKTSLQSSLAASLRSALAQTAALSKNTLDLSAARNKLSSAFARKTVFTQEQTLVTEPGLSKEELDAKAREEYEALLAERDAELRGLQSVLEALVADGKSKSKATDEYLSAARQIEAELADIAEKLAALEAAYKVKKRVLDLLPNAQENLSKLQELADNNANKLLTLNSEWDSMRSQLLEEYRVKREALKARKDVMTAKVEQMRKMRAEMKERVKEIKEKEDVYKQCVDELNALPKSINRQVYVKRISDIVKNIDKQKEEIRKILDDVRSIQREITVKSESVKRSFDVADELIYQTAKVRKDATAIQVYRNVVSLRHGFNHIIDTVENSGKTSNNVRELQQKVEYLESRSSSLNMENVNEDLAQVRKDNKILKQQLKELRGDEE